MQFFKPDAFLLFWMLPAVGAAFFLSRRLWERRLSQFGQLQTVRTKLLPFYRSTFKIRFVCILLVFLFAILALARPQWGEEKKKVERRGVNIIFLVDTSLSMLAEDIKPNRFDKSKLEIKSFIRRLKGDRVGMVAFSGSGFLQTPLTLDYSAFFLFLDGVKVGYIPDPGTSLDRALRLAVDSFPKKELKYKSLILFTDGEDHEGGIEQALEAAKKAGVRIYTVGVGTAGGEPIPLRDEQGKKSGFKKDATGQVVITTLNQVLLEKIAGETGGIYVPSTPSEQEVDIVLKHLAGLGQKQFTERLITEKEDHFQFFLFWALFFLVLEMLIRRGKKAMAPALFPLFFLIFSGFLESPRDLNEKGNKLYEEKKYQSALESYRKAGVKTPENPTINYNLASTLYKVNEYQEASQSLEKSLAQAKDPALRSRAYYNYGNVHYRLGNFEKAIEAYEKALEINPKDVDAKYNLEFLQKKKSSFEKKDQERQKDQEKQQQQQQKEDQQQSQQQQQQQNQQQQNQEEQGQDQQQPQENQGQDQQEEQKEKEEQESKGQKEEEEQKQGDQQDRQQSSDQQEEEQEQKGEQEQPARQDQAEQQEQPKEEEQQGKAPKPLQGQMTLENALRVLDALKESEKELQDLRRPEIPKDPPPVAKDW